nr:MAG TPA: hypothetical protein [Caudoviricetes sp.]
MATRKRKTAVSEIEKYERLRDQALKQTERQAKPAFGFDNAYEPAKLAQRDIRDIRKEYSRLRSIVRKRLDRMQNSEFAKTKALTTNVDKYKPLAEIKTTAELLKSTRDIAATVRSLQASVQGQRAIKYQNLVTLHEHGYTNVNDNNYQAFTQFMDLYHNTNLDKIYDSERIAELFESMSDAVDVNRKTIMNKFNAFMSDVDKTERVVDKIKKSGKSAARDFYRAFRESE